MDYVIFWISLLSGWWLLGRILGAAAPRRSEPEWWVRRAREGAEPYVNKGDW
jgi:hypothetical protein